MLFQPDTPEASERISDVRASLLSLKTCWESLQQQISDKDARLVKTLEFQTLHQAALQSISAWLDEVEQRLFVTSSLSAAASADDAASLQREIAALQAEIGVMNAASQQLMAEAGAGSRQLIRQAVDDLNERLRLLEAQAREREQSLQVQRQQQQSVEDEARELSRRMTGRCCSPNVG